MDKRKVAPILEYAGVALLIVGAVLAFGHPPVLLCVGAGLTSIWYGRHLRMAP